MTAKWFIAVIAGQSENQLAVMTAVGFTTDETGRRSICLLSTQTVGIGRRTGLLLRFVFIAAYDE